MEELRANERYWQNGRMREVDLIGFKSLLVNHECSYYERSWSEREFHRRSLEVDYTALEQPYFHCGEKMQEVCERWSAHDKEWHLIKILRDGFPDYPEVYEVEESKDKEMRE